MLIVDGTPSLFPLFPLSLAHSSPSRLVFLCFFFVVIFLIFLKLLEYLLNNFLFPSLLASYFGKISLQLISFSISIRNIQLPPPLLVTVNQFLHLNFQFDILEINLIQITLFPRIHVKISGITMRAYSKSPSNWKKEDIENALVSNRLQIIDTLTETIIKNIKMTTFHQINSFVNFPLHCVDIMIATAILKIESISISFCSRRSGQPDDVVLRAKIEQLLVHPSGSFTDLLYSPMFQMNVAIHEVSLTSHHYGGENNLESRDIPPLLYPTNIQGSIILPKITSQMIQKQPLLTKFCRLDLKADHLTVDFCAPNAVEVLNFTLDIVLYRLWYTTITNNYEKTLELAQETNRTRNDAIASYLASYSSFIACHDRSRRPQLLQNCREFEKKMSSSSIRLARALALGWRESPDFHQYLKRTRLSDLSWDLEEGTEALSKVIDSVFEKELLNFKELRFIEVFLTAKQVDFRLSTPRTRWDLQSPEKNSAPPVTFSMMDIVLEIVDPIVPACYLFDKVRDIKIQVGRMRLAAGETNSTPTPKTSLNKLIWDQCWIYQKDNDDQEKKDKNQVEDQDQDQEKQTSDNEFREDNPPMINLKIHEDPEMNITTVQAKMTNSAIVLDILNLIEILEYGLTAVEDMTSVFSYWTNYVELPPSLPPRLPASLFGGVNLRVCAEATRFGILLLENHPTSEVKDNLIHSNIFRIGFDASVVITSNQISESISGSLKDLQFSTYRQDLNLYATDLPYDGIRSCHLILNPYLSLGGSGLDQICSLDFIYLLCLGSHHHMSYTSSPSSNHLLSSERKFLRRRKSGNKELLGSSLNSKETPQSTLFRYLSVTSDPLVINIAEQEAKIIFRWAKHTIRAIPHAFASLNINVAKIQSTALEMNLKIEKLEYLTFMSKLFKKLQINGKKDDDLIPHEVMTSIFDLFLKPLHLTTSEFEENRRQLFLYFDKNLDHEISIKEFEERGLELYTKMGWKIRDNIPLKLREYTGVSISNYFMNSLRDTESLNEVWRRIEYETPLRRSWDTLRHGITPFLAQSLLVRVCEDAKIAKLLWENVIRTNFNDPLLKIYPWYANDDTFIASRHSIYEHAREIIGKQKVASSSEIYLKSPDPYLATPSHRTSRDFTSTLNLNLNHNLNHNQNGNGNGATFTRTEFDICLSTIQFNFIDNLLGPKMPRYQLNISNPSLQGYFSHDGLTPRMSVNAASTNLTTELIGNLTFESSFFNSLVNAHEPLIEPYTLKVSILKLGSTGSLRIDFQDQGPLVFNISTILMQTLAAFVISLEEATVMEFDDDDENENDEEGGKEGEDQMIPDSPVSTVMSPKTVGNSQFIKEKQTSTALLSSTSHISSPTPSLLSNGSFSSPLILIQNMCGAKLSVSLGVNPHRPSSSPRSSTVSPRIVLSEIEIPSQDHAQINTPWQMISYKYGDNIFPNLVFSVTLNTGICQQDYFRLHPLHSLSIEKIFIPLQDCEPPIQSPLARSRSRHEDTFIPAIVLDYKPNIDRGEHLLKHSAILLSRSNIQFKNTAGQPVSLRFTSKSDTFEPLELSVRDLDIQGLSVELACDPELRVSFKHGNTMDWSTNFPLRDILFHRKHVHHDTTTTLYLIVGHDILKNKIDQVDDYLIEIVSGIRIVNSLPYSVEVNYHENSGTKSKSLQQKMIRLIPGRCTLIPMIRIGSSFSLRIVGKKRIGGENERELPMMKQNWSEAVDLKDIFNGNNVNVTEETLSVPCKFHLNLKVKLRKIRDPSKDESFVRRYTSTPTIEIYTDFWIQNNSGIRLSYRMKSRSTGEVDILHDKDSGHNVITSGSPHHNNKSPLSGPLLGVVAMSSIQLKCDNTQETGDDHMISLQDFNNVSLRFPKVTNHNKTTWSPKVRLSETSFTSFELLFENIYFGLSLQPGVGVFHRTKILVITPRYVIQNLTSSLINIFPVRIWKRFRISSTGAESESVREYMDNVDATVTRRSTIDEGDTSVGTLRKSENQAGWSSYGLNDVNENEEGNGVDLTDGEGGDEIVFRDSADGQIGEVIPERYPPVTSGDDYSLNISSSDDLYFSLKPSCVSSFYSFQPTSPKLSSMVHSLCPALSLRLDSLDPHHSKDFKTPLPNVLKVRIISALDLSNLDHIGFGRNPRCHLYWMGELLHQTKGAKERKDDRREENSNTEWNESFDILLDVDDLLYADLRIEVVDLDLGVYSDFLGQIEITGDEILECTRSAKLISRKLSSKSSRDCKKVMGELKVEISLQHKTLNTWSSPFFISNRAVEYLTVRNSEGRKRLLEVRIHEIDSAMVVVICEHSSSNLPAFKIVNRTPDLQLRFRQHHTNKHIISRNIVPAASYCYYAWDNLCLPKLIEMVAVDDSGQQSPPVIYSLENVGLQMTKLFVRDLDNNREYLKAHIFVEGHTRVLVLSNDESQSSDTNLTPSYLGHNNLLSLILATDFEVLLSGVSVSLIDEHPEELITIDVEKIRIFSPARSMSWELTVNHIQLDNMTIGTTRYPVILSPPDSGLNSHLHEDYNDINQFIPSFKLIFEPDLENFELTKDAFVINHLDINLQDLLLCVDFNFIVKMVTSIITPKVLEAVKVGLRFWATIQKDPITQTQDILSHRIQSPHNRFLPEYMIMLKKLVIHSTVVKIMLSIAMDHAELDPRMGAVGSIEYSAIQILMSVSRGITNINPHFSFTGLVIDDAFDTVDNLGWRIGMVYATQAIVQTLKIIGSAEILGDPVGAIATLGSSVRVFVKKTKSELKGHSQSLGGGLKNLVQGVSGISFGSAAKMTKSIGEQLASISGSNFKSYMQEEDASHVGTGVVQGGTVFAKSMVNGVLNIGKKPLEGIQAGSVSQTAVGVVSGLSGLALAPVIGVLGFTAKLSQGIDSSTHIFDEKPHGRKRPARALFHDPKLKPLSRSIIFHRFTINFKGIQMLTSDCDAQSTAYLSIAYGSQSHSSSNFKLSSSLSKPGSEEIIYSFHFQAEMDKPSFRTQLLKIKLHIVGSTRFSGAKTVAKCYVHPVDIMSYFVSENSSRDSTTTSPTAARRGLATVEEGKYSPLLSTYSGVETIPYASSPSLFVDLQSASQGDGDDTVSALTIDSSHNQPIEKRPSFILDFANRRADFDSRYRCNPEEIIVTSPSPLHPERYDFTLGLISKSSQDDESQGTKTIVANPTIGGSDEIYDSSHRDIFCQILFNGSYPPL